MKKIFKIIASLFLIASVAACGGGSGGSSNAATPTTPATPSWETTSGSDAITKLQVTDNIVGTGVTATAGDTLTISFTGWEYESSAANFEGPQYYSSSGTPSSFVVGVGQSIAGLDQGLIGMKVGGTRTLIIPSALAYGTAGYGTIPAGAALVVTVQLLNDQQSFGVTSGSNAVTTLMVTDNVVGTGATAATGDTLTVNYTGWLYQSGAANSEGGLNSGRQSGTPFSFALGAGQVIAGWDQGLAGMKVGGTRTLIIPSALGYGATGNSSIPGGAALVFTVQLVNVTP